MKFIVIHSTTFFFPYLGQKLEYFHQICTEMKLFLWACWLNRSGLVIQPIKWPKCMCKVLPTMNNLWARVASHWCNQWSVVKPQVCRRNIDRIKGLRAGPRFRQAQQGVIRSAFSRCISLRSNNPTRLSVFWWDGAGWSLAGSHQEPLIQEIKGDYRPPSKTFKTFILKANLYFFLKTFKKPLFLWLKPLFSEN